MHVCPVKTDQTAKSDQSLRRALWTAKDPKRLQVDSEIFDQPAGHICNLIGKYKNVSSGICEQWRPRSACISTQSDQGLHCPLTENCFLQNV